MTQISFKGFLEGQFTPDVAEIIKPALGIFLVDLALINGVEPKMFVDNKPVEGDVSDENFFEILKENNPKLFAGMVEELNKMQRENTDGQIAAMQPKAPAPPSFLTTDEKPET